MNNSLGLVEVKGFCASIFTVDTLLKNASVSIGLEEIKNGNVILKLKGTLPQINYAVSLAVENANKISSVVSYSVLEKINPVIEQAFFVNGKKSSHKKQIKESFTATTVQTHTTDKPEKINSTSAVSSSRKPITIEPKSEKTKKVIKQHSTDETLSSTIERLRLEALGKKAIEVSERVSDKTEKTKSYDIKKISDLDGLNVHKLRRAARDFDNFPIKGRQISRANRDELMVYFKQILPE
ncbi:MAG: BMC domain-containing protein [Ignavibacterium sp.]|jgi:microcompartment protein CcmL/EutN|uniref:BMC domain-containing protein n=1 Tax=Ignavibacterium sp. TaxID=2651167 RepID=UPI003298C72D